MSQSARSFRDDTRRPLAQVAASLLSAAMDGACVEEYLGDRVDDINTVATLCEEKGIPFDSEQFVATANKANELLGRLREQQPVRESDFSDADKRVLADVLQFAFDPLFALARGESDKYFRSAERFRKPASDVKTKLERTGQDASHLHRLKIDQGQITEQNEAFLRQVGTDLIDLCDHLNIPLRTPTRQNFAANELDSPR